jgi:hypothetical protein
MGKTAGRRITVVLAADVAHWAQLQAARRDVSVPRLIADVIEDKMRDDAEYDAAMQRFRSRTSFERREPGPYPARDMRHERG